MQAQHPSGSAVKATTAPRHLVAIATVGQALISYQIQKTPAARARLQSLAELARRHGELTAADAAVVAELLAKPCAAPRPASPTLN